MRTMNNDTSLHAMLNRISAKDALRTLLSVVEVKAVLSLDSSLSTFLHPRKLNTHNARVSHNNVQSHRASLGWQQSTDPITVWRVKFLVSDATAIIACLPGLTEKILPIISSDEYRTR